MTWPDTDEESEWQRRDEIHSNLQKPHPVHPLPSVPSVPSVPSIPSTPFPLTPLTLFAILQGQRQLSHSTCDVSGCRDVEPISPSTLASPASTAPASCKSLRSDHPEAKSGEVADRPPVRIEAKPVTRAKGRKPREMLPERNDLQPRGLGFSSFSSFSSFSRLKDGASNGSNESNRSRDLRDLKGAAASALPGA